MPDHRNPSLFLIAIGLLAANLIVVTASAQRDLTDIPEPDPVAERAAMKIDERSEVNLFAADPDISKPIQMNFDSTGGLWIASSEVYPQIRPGEVANDKIIVLRDTDGDGISDSRTVFADGLLIPTGVIPDGPHAAYVAESTRLLYLEDTDQDGKADRRQIVLSGFGTEDTHHLVHTLRFGPDGCLYFNQSIYIHSHIDTPYGTRHLDGGGIWRYRPRTRELEVLCKGFVNPWGHVFDHVGESFATDGAYFEGINYVFPDSVFVTSPGATRWLKGMNPGSPKHCGVEILSGTHVPPEWSGDFVANDFRSHRVCRFTLKPSGSSYISRQQPEIITTQHVAFRPIDARMGPDGALYVADWYNPIIQHGEVDFRDDRRDREHGRIWRVTFPPRELDLWPDFAKASLDQLLQLLEDPALPVRQFARQEMWKRAAQNPRRVLAAYQPWVNSDRSKRMIELLWINEVLPENSADVIVEAMASMDDLESQSRRTALRSIWRSRRRLDDSPPQRKFQQQIEQFVLDSILHEDPRVRLEAVASAGQIDASNRPDAVMDVLQALERDVDPNLDFAIWQSTRNLDASYANGSVLSAVDGWDGRQNQLAYAVSAIKSVEAAEVAVKLLESEMASAENLSALIQSIAVAGDASQLGRVVATLVGSDASRLSHARLKPLFDRTLRDGTVPEGVSDTLGKIAVKPKDLRDQDRVQAVARIAMIWKVRQYEGVLIAALEEAEGSLRERIIESLGAFDSGKAKQKLAELATDADAPTRIAATLAIANRKPADAVDLIIGLLKTRQTAEAATNMVTSMLGKKGAPGMLAAAIRKQRLSAENAASLLRRVRAAGGNANLEAAIRSSGGLENTAWKLTPALKDEILRLVKTDGSPTRGEEIYRREKLQCVICHAIGSGGGVVGPNLISTGGSSQPDYILESLLDPSAKLKEGFTTLTLLTDESEILNGIVIGRTNESLRLRLADGKEVQVAADSILQEKPGKSLMPEGTLDTLTKAELVDLVAFLSALGRVPEFTVSTEPIVRNFETLIYTNEANRRLNRTSTDTAVSGDAAMNWRPITAKVDGTIDLKDLDVFQQHRETPPTSFARFVISLPVEGVAKLDLPTEGIDAWVDAKPTPIWNLKSLKLEAGKHTVVIAIDRSVRKQPFAVMVGGDAVETK